MIMSNAATSPLWQDEPRQLQFGPPREDVRVDVAIIGGGITGATTAWLLKRAGRTVALVERRQCGGGDTGHTTAHLTAVTDTPLTELIDRMGPDHAQAVWDAGFAAIQQIHDIATREAIACAFRWVTGYYFARDGEDLEAARTGLEQLAQAAANLGFDASYLDRVPVFDRPGVAFPGQARFHPLRYLHALVSCLPGDGSVVFEDTEVTDVTDDPLTVHAGGRRVQADYLVTATHAPLMSALGGVRATHLQTDLFAYSTYAIAGRLPPGSVPEGLYWDNADPYTYLRVDAVDDHDRLILGGEDHRTGQVADTTACFDALVHRLLEIAPRAEVTHRWSGQVIETRDGLPYIGELAPRRFCATGFAGNGMTFGTLGGMMAADAVLGRANPWTTLFDIHRTQLLTGMWDYLRENSSYPYYLIRDRFAGAETRTLRDVPRGEGRIVELDGRDEAVYREESGVVVRLSPICTHMGCKVAWNRAERTWDCPCHGSRFTPQGEVLAGPAERPLAPAAPAAGRERRPV
jgi:glycine/D-amino acid oxidase-like deaminating enzyme/nitrite reductase/ring-hydroxylating ferredoxin subunit